jgi:hypothetical protein
LLPSAIRWSVYKKTPVVFRSRVTAVISGRLLALNGRRNGRGEACVERCSCLGPVILKVSLSR